MKESGGPGGVEIASLAALIGIRSEVWRAGGIDVDAVVRVTGDHSQKPDVVGVALSRHGARGRVMVYGGGWADFEFTSGGSRDGDILEIHPVTNDSVETTVEELLERLTCEFDQWSRSRSSYS